MIQTDPVPYSQIMKEIKTGDLIAWKTDKYRSILTFILFLYQKLTGALYTHVGIVVKIGGKLYVIEAVPPLVRIYPLENKEEFYWIDAKVNAPAARQLKFLTSEVGKPYSILDMFKSVFRLENNTKDYYCSELAAEFYYNFGYISDKSVGHSPDTMVRAISEIGDVEIIQVTVDKGNL